MQALERTQPLLPGGLGYVEGVTHYYRRHGTTTMFAGLDTAIFAAAVMMLQASRSLPLSQNTVTVGRPFSLGSEILGDK